jgi:AcrR family transcriptional regulator
VTRHPAPLTREAILNAAERVILRHGPDKATVVDVARMLGISHGSVYNFFESKSDLRRAVVEAWLAKMDAPLARITALRGSPKDRLVKWLDAFVAARQRTWRDDPALFAALQVIASEQPLGVWQAYLRQLRQTLAGMIEEGVALGIFRPVAAEATAAAFIDAHVRFFHSSHYREWADPRMGPAYKAVRDLMIAGLSTGA